MSTRSESSWSDFVDTLAQPRDFAQDWVAGIALIDAYIRGWKAILQNLHDTRDDLYNLRILNMLVRNTLYTMEAETNFRIDCIEDSVQPNKTLGNISLQFLSNDCSGRQGHQRWNVWKVCGFVANEYSIEEFGWTRRVQPLTTLAYAT